MNSDDAATVPAAMPGAMTGSACKRSIWASTSAETGFQIDRSADGVTGWTLLATAAPNVTHYSDTNAAGENTSRCYRVRAVNGAGDSAYTNVAGDTTLLATPTSLVASIVDGSQVNLTWNDNSAIETGYFVEQWMPDDQTWQQVQWADADAESLAVFGTFEPTTAYAFRVLAYAETESYAAYSAPSNEATVTALGWPAAPTDLTAMAVSNTEIDLTWTDNATNETGYVIDRTLDGQTWTELTATLPPNSVSYSDVGLTDGTLYAYRVRAFNAVGGSGYAINAAATLPTAPTNLQATVVSGTEIDLTWTAAPYATGYTIWKLGEGDADWTLVTNSVPSNQTSYNVTGLLAGGAYYGFCVFPTNSTADSAIAYVDAQTVNVAPVVSQVSSAAGTVENPVTGNSTTLSVAASDDGNSADLIYTWSLSYSDGGQAYFGDGNGTHDASSIQVTFTRAGTYVFNVEVEDACGLTDPPITIHVAQDLTAIAVTPGDAAVLLGKTRQFTAIGIDQFGNAMTNQPSFYWTVDDAVSRINSSGLYTAPASGNDSSCTISAYSGNNFGEANVAVKKTTAQTVVDFDDLDVGTVVTNQYADKGVTFSCDSGFTNKVTSDWSSHTIGTWPLSSNNFDRNLYVQFASPVNNLTFQNGIQDPEDGERSGTVRVYQNGQYTASVPLPGSDWAVGTMDLSAYQNITRIEIVDVSMDLCGLVYDNFSFGVAPRLLELSVADHAAPFNKATAITDQAIKDLYLNEDPTTHAASVDVSSLFAPDTNETKKDIRLSITRSDGYVTFDGTLDQFMFSTDRALSVTAQARDWVFKEWMDYNYNGQCDSGEDKREVDVHVIGIRSDNNFDGVVNATDDALNAIQPNAINLEYLDHNVRRTEVDLKIGAPGGSGGGYKVVVPNVAGYEFWTAAAGGTRLLPDAYGNIIDTTIDGAYTRTIWVSATSATMLSATANAPAGRAGDAKISMQVKNKVGQTVAQTWIGVNRPVEVLYAVDGTSFGAANDGNVRQFEQRYQGVDGTDRHYYAGPRNVRTGSDSPGIVTDVENQIQADYTMAIQRHRRLVIDLVGWSRGAVIAGTVALDLNAVNLTAMGFAIQPGAPQHIDVHWVGLFDAVSQMGGIGDPSIAPHNAWATAFSNNVHAHYHLIHTYHGVSRTYSVWGQGPNEDTLFPTEMGFVSSPGTTPTPFNMPNGSSHGDVGTNRGALNMMINNARAARVSIR